MSTLSTKALALAALGLAAQACTLASPTTVKYEPAEDATSESDATEGDAKKATSTSSASTASTCSAKFTKPDTSKLAVCGGDHGHCYAKDKMPAALGAMFSTCPAATDVCVPDEVLSAAGNKLTTCKVAALNGKPGGCIQIDLIPQMKAQGGGSLTQDICDADQVCAPCQDPTNGNADTPFCQPIGVMDGVCSGGATTTPAPAAATCCTTNGKSNGVCIDSSAIPANSQSSTIKDTCTGTNKCVPKAMVEGKPVTCDGGLLGKGVCMDKCFSDMLGMAGSIGFLSGDGCGETELCIPCQMASMQSGSTPIPGCQ